MKIAVITFPASNCDRDAVCSVEECGAQAVRVHHSETSLPDDIDGIILPGGFSYGDYLRPGCMAARSPIMIAIRTGARNGMPVLGICNGFQLLTEAGLLPGALLRNRGLRFVCRSVNLRLARCAPPFTHLYRDDAVLSMPIAHKDGNYFADDDTLRSLEDEDQIVLRYCNGDGVVTLDANPNGSRGNIAAICNPAGNILGIMPHPERCADVLLGGLDGKPLFQGFVSS